MALLDLFKKKKKIKGVKEVKKTLKTEKKVKEVVKEIKEKTIAKPKRGIVFSYNIVRNPHISEKTTSLAKNNQYIFKVFSRANKTEIKKAVEGLYGVDVLSVNLIKIPAKKRTLGRISGFRKGYKKAIVKIKEGQKIEIL